MATIEKNVRIEKNAMRDMYNKEDIGTYVIAVQQDNISQVEHMVTPVPQTVKHLCSRPVQKCN